jgi:hypothetical protein
VQFSWLTLVLGVQSVEKSPFHSKSRTSEAREAQLHESPVLRPLWPSSRGRFVRISFSGIIRREFASSIPQAVALLERKGRTNLAPSLLSSPSATTNSPPTHLRRLATLVAQPVAITLSLGSRISSATVSVNASPSILTSMARVSLCVCIQAPAGLKMKASVTAL